VSRIDEIDLERMYRAEDLINILRARTFPPYGGAYFRHNGKKIYLNLELSEEPVSDARQAGDKGTGEAGSGTGNNGKPGNSN
jgi:hypothetical protein